MSWWDLLSKLTLIVQVFNGFKLHQMFLPLKTLDLASQHNDISRPISMCLPLRFHKYFSSLLNASSAHQSCFISLPFRRLSQRRLLFFYRKHVGFLARCNKNNLSFVIISQFEGRPSPPIDTRRFAECKFKKSNHPCKFLCVMSFK